MCIRDRIQKFANRYLAARSIFFIGRGIDYAISLEGSLKLKEVSYIHSEAYAAGELKHGTISVSYTHLDVYKRQGKNLFECGCHGCSDRSVSPGT